MYFLLLLGIAPKTRPSDECARSLSSIELDSSTQIMPGVGYFIAAATTHAIIFKKTLIYIPNSLSPRLGHNHSLQNDTPTPPWG
jgi:hypothetical protein